MNNTESIKMPVLFVGHGNPMNAIEENEFTKTWNRIGISIPTPQAIICISAHWETRGTQITAMSQPRTIHDFGGFPRELFEVEYPAPGNPALAEELKKQLEQTAIELDYSDWGLDHGTWSVVKHIYPKANIPIIQISLNRNQSPKQHYEFAKNLAYLRKKGILIIGSGNIVHNLRRVDWQNQNSGFDWAQEANQQMKSWITDGNHQALIDYQKQGTTFDLAIPTPEHYLPLLYALALQNNSDKISFFNDELVMGSLSMTSVMIG